ncbi:MAG: hypothetical protein WA705_19425 [Candidatus Ozemobacteraceae bacterium]
MNKLMLKRFCRTLMVLGFCVLTFPTFAQNPEIPVTLSLAQQCITEEFNRLDAAMKRTAEKIGEGSLTGDSARAALCELVKEFPDVTDFALVSPKGRMVTVEPASYKKSEGISISSQEQVKRVKTSGKPVMSTVFKAVEGFDAVDAEYPLLASDGRFLGAVSALIRPEMFLEKLIRPLVQGIPVNIWVMDKDGRIIYDVDKSQIGLNLFQSDLYKPYADLITLGRRIAENAEGSGTYRFKTFQSGKVQGEAEKTAFWQTASLYSTEWRIVGMHVKEAISGRNSKVGFSLEEATRMLEALATDPACVNALEKKDKTSALQLFQEMFDSVSEIYSVQWIDENGINQFGFPETNSLFEYDYHTKRDPNDPKFLEVISEKKPASLEIPLLEGQTGCFTLRPVFSGSEYLGMIYFIHLKDK